MMERQPEPGDLLITDFGESLPGPGWTKVEHYPTFGWRICQGDETLTPEPFIVSPPGWRTKHGPWADEAAANWAHFNVSQEIDDRKERVREDEWQAMRDAPDIRKRKRNERLLSIHEANVAASTGQLGEIIALHAPSPDKRYPALVWCAGCPAHGFEAEPGEWPCRTYKIATRHLKGLS